MPFRESNEAESLLKPKEVAGLLRIHLQTVYEKARTGELPGVRVGRLWRFRPSDVAEYQASHVQATEEVA